MVKEDSILTVIKKRLLHIYAWLKSNTPWLFSGIGVAIVGIFITFSVSNKKESKTIINNTVINKDSSIHNTTINNNLNKSYSKIQKPTIKADTLDLAILKSILNHQENVDAILCYKVIYTHEWKFSDSTFRSLVAIDKNPNMLMENTGKFKIINNETEIELIFDKYPKNKITLYNVSVINDIMKFELSYKNKMFYRMTYSPAKYDYLK